MSTNMEQPLFQRVCEMDLEGIVAKHARNYSQMAGREELFNRERHREPVAGWHACDLVCPEVES